MVEGMKKVGEGRNIIEKQGCKYKKEIERAIFYISNHPQSKLRLEERKHPGKAIKEIKWKEETEEKCSCCGDNTNTSKALGWEECKFRACMGCVFLSNPRGPCPLHQTPLTFASRTPYALLCPICGERKECGSGYISCPVESCQMAICRLCYIRIYPTKPTNITYIISCEVHRGTSSLCLEEEGAESTWYFCYGCNKLKIKPQVYRTLVWNCGEPSCSFQVCLGCKPIGNNNNNCNPSSEMRCPNHPETDLDFQRSHIGAEEDDPDYRKDIFCIQCLQLKCVRNFGFWSCPRESGGKSCVSAICFNCKPFVSREILRMSVCPMDYTGLHYSISNSLPSSSCSVCHGGHSLVYGYWACNTCSFTFCIKCKPLRYGRACPTHGKILKKCNIRREIKCYKCKTEKSAASWFCNLCPFLVCDLCHVKRRNLTSKHTTVIRTNGIRKTNYY